jgi:hypothetical protein
MIEDELNELKLFLEYLHEQYRINEDDAHELRKELNPFEILGVDKPSSRMIEFNHDLNLMKYLLQEIKSTCFKIQIRESFLLGNEVQI